MSGTRFGRGKSFVVDATPPTISSRTIPSAGATIVCVATENITGTVGTGWTVSASGGACTVSSGSGSGTSTLTLTLSRTILNTETVTLSYSSVTGDLADGSANDLATFSDAAVTNNSTQTASEDDPELPAEFTPSLPANWNAAADFTPANAAALTTALGSLAAGDVIQLTAGVDYGKVDLPVVSGVDNNNWIIIRTANYASLPASGSRVNASYESHMPRFTTGDTEAALTTENAAAYYWILGVEFEGTSDVSNIVTLGPGYPNHPDLSAELPHHIVFDRCYVHGTTTHNTATGVALDGNNVAVINSRVAEIHHTDLDSQAILCFNGEGPVTIQNNFLEGAGENVMFGGLDPSISGLVPADIVVRNNHFSKNASWQNTIPSGPHAGDMWVVKNIFELKNAQRVLIEGNIFEHCWEAAQAGFAIQFTPRNQDGGAPQATVEDVTFRLNMVRDSTSFCNILSSDTDNSSQTTKRILFENNLIYDIESRIIELSTNPSLPASEDLWFRNNTMIHLNAPSGNSFLLVSFKNPSSTGFVFLDNIATHGDYGLLYDSGGTLSYDTFENNVISGGDSNVPANNFDDVAFASIGFVNAAADDYELSGGSAYKDAGSDGDDIGCDITALEAELAGVEE